MHPLYSPGTHTCCDLELVIHISHRKPRPSGTEKLPHRHWMNAHKEAQRYHLEQCPMPSPCGSQGYNTQTIEPMAHSLHPARVLLSLAVLDYKEPHPWIKLYSIPASGHSWLPHVLFQYKNPRGLCKGDFCLFCVPWSSREKHHSQNLVSCEEI